MSADETPSQLVREDLDVMLEWAAVEGWNPGLIDGDAFWAADSGGFWGIKDEQGLASCISAIRYGSDYGFVGFYICRPDRRGEGLGFKTWNAALDGLDQRTLGLDGVVEHQADYGKSGFTLCHRNIRYSGLSTVSMPHDPRLAPIGTGTYTSIRDYDRAFFPAPRESFLQQWHRPMERNRFGFCAVEDGHIRGCGTLRACREGFKIGPLFAETPEIADLLFRALAGSVRGQMVILDLPEVNAEAEALVDRYELSPVFETARMYRGPAPELPLDKIYGITTFELG
ncbi:GNAT family N-acetyltransferase [Pseudovibrio exalbescens]|uniref:GNAT family N-acetyltransferase n=1 Tax=Pseudovibrio exalbescens TaxID=197461 RepID=UPI002365F4C7|nr:GNAT family N-acetyltransferase [Pseudovibrio exalbescens]MDD7909598.1 GNAT family N-acetyltransferase [Pseudovibrio exalbescens]